MAVRLVYPVDDLEIQQRINSGWVRPSLWVADSASSTWIDSNTTPTPATYQDALDTGVHEFVFDYAAGNQAQWFRFRGVDATNAFSPLSASAPFWGQGGTTLASLTAKLGKMVRDYVAGTTTAGGTTTTFVCGDIDVASRRDGHYQNYTWRRTDTGVWSPVTDWTQSTKTGTLAFTLDSAVGSGVAFELFKRWTPDEYRDALNWAIVNCYPLLNRPIINTAYYTIDDSYTITVPADFKSVSSVQYESGWNLDSSDPSSHGQPWRDIAFERIMDGNQIILEFKRPPFKTTGRESRRLRIQGDGILSQLHDSSDYVEVAEPQTDLLCYKAASQLYSMLMGDAASTDNDRYKAMATYYLNLFEEYKSQATMPRKPVSYWAFDPLWGNGV